MRCALCGNGHTLVTNSRPIGADGEAIRRRRSCGHCNRRFSTVELFIPDGQHIDGAGMAAMPMAVAGKEAEIVRKMRDLTPGDINIVLSLVRRLAAMLI